MTDRDWDAVTYDRVSGPQQRWAAEQLALPEPVDVVFSNATFHWIPDHDALFEALHRNMKPGARLLAQCGGRGNIDAFRKTSDAVAREEPFAASRMTHAADTQTRPDAEWRRSA